MLLRVVVVRLHLESEFWAPPNRKVVEKLQRAPWRLAKVVDGWLG